MLRADQPVDTATVLASERAIIRDRFGGSVSRYRGALSSASITLADARAIIADRLARDRVKERFRPKPATAPQIARLTKAADAVAVLASAVRFTSGPAISNCELDRSTKGDS